MGRRAGRRSRRKEKGGKEPRPLLPPFRLATADETRRFHRLLLVVVAVYCLTFSSVPVSNTDAQLMLTSAFTFWETGKLAAPERYATPTMGGQLFGQQALTGEVYAKYPPGYPLILVLYLPLVGIVAGFFGSLAADVMLCLPSVLANALAVLVIWRSALRLGCDARAANLVALGLGLGSLLWPYAGTNWSEPYQALLVALAFYCILCAVQEETFWLRYSLAGGFAMGYAILVKSSLGAIVAVLCAGFLAHWWAARGFRTAFRRTAVFALPAAAASIYLLAVNYVLFGSATDFGYRTEMDSFGTPLLDGLYYLTVGPRKGILYFLPLTVLAVWGVIRLPRRQDKVLLGTAAAAAVVYLCLISTWNGFEGGKCWGPRLLIPVVPFLVLLAGTTMGSAFSRRAAYALVAVGIAVNALGALINYQAYQGTVQSRLFRDMEPAVNQIAGHFWLLRVEAGTPLDGSESLNPLWKRPPWIGKYPKAIPLPYTEVTRPILNPWTLRLLLPESRWARGETWYLRGIMEMATMRYLEGDLRRALQIVDRGLEIDPRSKELLAARGMIHLSRLEPTQALEHFDRSLGFDGNYELALYGRGLALEALGDNGAARDVFRRLLELPPQVLSADEIRERLERIAP